jgi:nucleotide-binding universal stress UspA family protein
MEKLASILAVIQDIHSEAVVIEKAVQLARTFRARLELLVRQPGEAQAAVSRCAALGFDTGAFVSPFGPLSQAIPRRLRDRPADLVIKRLEGSDARRFWLAAGDHSLAESCHAPLMLVRDRPWAAEPRFAAAVDVADRDTESLARAILHDSGFLALGCEAWLDVLYSEREQQDQRLRMERAVRLARLVREFHVGGERLQVFDGAPEKTLPTLVSTRQYDVLVAGAVSRRNALRSAFGTLTSALVDATVGDVLLVKPTVSAAVSAAEQLAHEREQLARVDRFAGDAQRAVGLELADG